MLNRKDTKKKRKKRSMTKALGIMLVALCLTAVTGCTSGESAHINRDSASAEICEFVDNFNALADLADTYSRSIEDGSKAAETAGRCGSEENYVSWLCFMYMRSQNPEYTGLIWNLTAGETDSDFIEYVNEKNTELGAYFTKDLIIEDAEIAHMSATLTSLLYNPCDTKVGTEELTAMGVIPQLLSKAMATQLEDMELLPVRMGNVMTDEQYDDISGWAGDLQTFVGDMENLADYSSVEANRTVARKHMERPDNTLPEEDLCADMDAVNIRALLENSSLKDAMEIYYFGRENETFGVKERTRLFLNGRSETQLAEAAAVYTVQDFAPIDSMITMMAEMRNKKTNWPIYMLEDISPTKAQAIGIAEGYAEYVFHKLSLEKGYISNCTISAKPTEVTYDGRPHTPQLEITDCGIILQEEKDYTTGFCVWEKARTEILGVKLGKKSEDTSLIYAGTYELELAGLNGYEGTATATFVIEKADRTIKVERTDCTMTLGEGDMNLNAELGDIPAASPEKDKASLQYRSSDTEIATVSKTGTVTAKSAGNCTISITTKETPNYKAGKKEISVTVLP